MFPTRLINMSSLVFSNSCYLLWLTQNITSPSCLFNPLTGVNLPHCTDRIPLIFSSQLRNELGYGSYWLHTCYSPQSAQPESYCPDPVPPLFQQTNAHNFKICCTQIWSRYRAPEFTTLVRYLTNLILYKWLLGIDRNSRGSGLVPDLS